MGADSVGYAPGALISGSRFTMAMSPRISVSCSINCNTVSLRAGVETPQGTHARMWSGIDACPELGARVSTADPGDRVAYASPPRTPVRPTSPDPPLHHHHRHAPRRRDRDRAQARAHAVA